MSEQPHYKLTPEQGWVQMKQILDQEIPVDRRKRRFAFVWWRLGAAMAVLVIGLALWLADKSSVGSSHTVKPTSAQAEASQDPAAVSQQKELRHVDQSVSTDPATDPEIRNNKVSTPSNVKSLPPSPPPSTSRTNAIPLKEKRVKELRAEPMAQAVSEEDNHGFRPGDQMADVASLSDPSAATPESQALPAALGESPVSATSASSVLVTDPLPGLSIALPAIAHQEISGIPVEVSPVRANRFSVRPYVSLAGMAGYEGGMGAQAGLGLNMNVTRKLAFVTEASFRSFSPYASFLSGSVSRDLASNTEANAILSNDVNYQGYETYIEGVALSSGAAYNAIRPFVDQVKQWQISGGLIWRFSKQLSVEGGVMYALHTTVNSEYPIIEGDPFVATPFDKVSNSFNSYDLVRTSMTSWYAGVGYRIGRHLDIGLKWTHGLDQYLRTSTEQEGVLADHSRRTDVIRGLGLGLRYTL